jgi:uncharacterized membrane protein
LRRWSLAALCLLALGWAAVLWVPPVSNERVNDLFVYRSFAVPVLDGGLPYRDVFLEYPPLAAPAIALPALAGRSEEAFRLAFAGWTFLLAAAVVLLCDALAARTGGEPRRALLAAALMPLLCGALVRTHFDLAPVALTLGALLLLALDRPRAGLAVLGLGVMTKGFPLVVAPVALAWVGARLGRRAALRSAAALAAAVAVLSLAALAASPRGVADTLDFQLDRPVQVESAPAAALYALDGLGAGRALHVTGHRSDGLRHPAAGAVAGVLLAATFAAVALLAVLAARRPGDPRALVLASLAAVVAFVALGRVLSPQYVVWVVPLGALALAWRLHALALAVAAAAVLTQLEFPARYFDLLGREPAAVALVCLRDAVLLGVLALAVRALQPRREQDLVDARGAPLAVALH